MQGIKKRAAPKIGTAHKANIYGLSIALMDGDCQGLTTEDDISWLFIGE